jgi:hypothetical protein
VPRQQVLEALLGATDLPVNQFAVRCGLGTAANLRLRLTQDAATTRRLRPRLSRAPDPRGRACITLDRPEHIAVP